MRRGLMAGVLLGVIVMTIMIVLAYSANKTDLGTGEKIATKEELMAMVDVSIVQAPDQEEVTEHEAFIHEVFVPIIPTGTNIALESKVEVSSFTQTYTGKKAIDGNTGGPSYWEGEPDTYPNTITLDFQRLADIHAIKLLLNPAAIWGRRTQTFTVLAGNNSEELEVLYPESSYEFDPVTGNQVLFEFDTVNVQFVSIVFSENTGGGAGQLAELEVYE